MADTSPPLAFHGWIPGAVRCAQARETDAFVGIDWDLCDRERFTVLVLCSLPTTPLWGGPCRLGAINAVIYSLP